MGKNKNTVLIVAPIMCLVVGFNTYTYIQDKADTLRGVNIVLSSINKESDEIEQQKPEEILNLYNKIGNYLYETVKINKEKGYKYASQEYDENTSRNTQDLMLIMEELGNYDEYAAVYVPLQHLTDKEISLDEFEKYHNEAKEIYTQSFSRIAQLYYDQKGVTSFEDYRKYRNTLTYQEELQITIGLTNIIESQKNKTIVDINHKNILNILETVDKSNNYKWLTELYIDLAKENIETIEIVNTAIATQGKHTQFQENLYKGLDRLTFTRAEMYANGFTPKTQQKGVSKW